MIRKTKTTSVTTTSLSLAIATLLLVTGADPVLGQTAGRRFEVQVQNGRIIAQGFNSGPNDMLPDTRPFINSMHDHWSPLGGFSFSTLPGYDIPNPGPLAGHPLDLTLVGSSKWVNPPLMPAPGTIPNLEPLAAGEVMSIKWLSDTIDTVSKGTLRLSPSVPAAGLLDVDPFYQINAQPTDSIYVLESQLTAPGANLTGAGANLSSDTIYTILSPAGNTPAERLHLASLFLESYLGTPLAAPEPSSFALSLLGVLVLAAGGSRRRNRTGYPRQGQSECL